MSSIHSWFMMLALSLLEAGQRLWRQLTTKLRDERGDVPGWVMITLMSALLVAALLAIAGPRLQDLFNQAIDRVSGLG
ncbi:hypothetical protein GCM10007173_29350 [Glutamicibacter ardleyensis]|jgi:ABC-type transport system involved in cytochrome c biogenesis permease subunit|uniref:DUF4244 domain-containing protein n=2 Tax=Glutamicibacter ardleyensis TaxID=225894 RepID=A0ABQ2DR54_9MICC|nr:hypothetical protein GCM10007173_29350 [Glutamicibacter ardleyensis]